MVPGALRALTVLNPMFYMVNGMRYGMLGVSDVPVWQCAAIVLVIFFALFFYTVYLFRTGFKLRK
jgi:ABC-2 type transport system permease protein